jgi:serine-type D-Ala-D-Ala carboxypeptidase (penicillin-binding protein 5/6)
MTLLPTSIPGRLSLFVAPIALAMAFLAFSLPPQQAAQLRAKSAAMDSPKSPKVLGENSLRQTPVVVLPAPPSLTKPLATDGVRAKSFLIYDFASGAKLGGRNEHYPLPIASLTKLMTAYVAYQYTTLSQETVTVKSGDPLNVSPVLGLQVGDKAAAIDLFNSMLVGSANDAAQILGNYVGRKTGTPFVELMNQSAQEIGMNESHFSNPMGFDSETNYSTASDLELLVNAVKQFQAFSLVGRETSYQFTAEDGKKFYVKATNKLLPGDPEISAIKTGYTDEAQGEMITEINHVGHKFIIIVLGSPNREQDTLKLKKSVLDSYKWK